MKCKQCGKHIKSSENKCSACGSFVEASISLGAMSAKEKKQAKKKKAKRQLTGTEKALRISLIVVSILAVLGILFGILYIYARSMITKNAHIDDKFTEQEKQELHINTELPTVEDGILNIALFGLDERGDTGETVDSSGKGKSFHSDAIIILTIDRRADKEPAIKMTSIARDTLVVVEGYSEYYGLKDKTSRTKLTHAFQFGYSKAKNADAANRNEIRKKYKGKELKAQLAQLEANYKREGAKMAIATLNKNFNLNISEYMYVNFVEFMDIIDYMGGVTINVQQRELNELNKHVRAMEKECGRDLKTVKKAGKQTLDGGQALAYSRIRKIDSDLKRANRQRDVLQSLFNEVKGTPVNKLPDVVSKMLSMCHTTLTAEQILELGTWAVTNGPEIVSYTMPDTGVKADWIWEGTHPTYGWVWIYDLDYASSLIIDFIFSEVSSDKLPKPTLSSEPVVTAKTTQPSKATGTKGTTSTGTTTSTSVGTTTTSISGPGITYPTDGMGPTTRPSESSTTRPTLPNWTGSPIESTDPIRPTGPTMPNISTRPTLPNWVPQSTGSTVPTGGTGQPTDPTGMTDSTDVIGPTDPTWSDPTDTTGSTDVVNSTDPMVTDPTETMSTVPTETEGTTASTDPMVTDPVVTDPTVSTETVGTTAPIETQPTAPMSTEPAATDPTDPPVNPADTPALVVAP